MASITVAGMTTSLLIPVKRRHGMKSYERKASAIHIISKSEQLF